MKKRSGSSRSVARPAAKKSAIRLHRTTLKEARAKFDAGLVPYHHVREEDIDFSDIPELTPEQLTRMRPVYENGRMVLGRRPEAYEAAKGQVSVPLDSELVTGLKREAKRKRTTYQSLIHRILKDHLAQLR